MAWTADTGVQVQNLITQIATRLTNSGWTLHDRAQDQVWKSTNNQGVVQYVQITNCQNSGAAGSGAAWQYLQFQGWRDWNTGTHAGSNGSGTSYYRLYYAGTNVAAATTVDLYMSVTTNRFIMFIQGVGNFRHWHYFGGLDALAGTSDPFCVYQVGALVYYNIEGGVILLPAGGSSTWWTTVRLYSVAQLTVTSTGDYQWWTAAVANKQMLASDPTQVLGFPVLVADDSFPYFRGAIDGILYLPVISGSFGHLDTITIGGVTYLIIIPGGAAGVANTQRAITGNFGHALAIAEV